MNYYILSAIILLLVHLGTLYYDVKKETIHLSFWVGIIGLIGIRMYSIFSPEYLNIDEAEWLSLASRLPQCDIPYRCYDPHTTGFFNIFILKIFYFFGIGYNYTSLRLFGLFFCTLPTIFIFYHVIKNKYKGITAILSITLLIHFFIFGAYSTDFLAYNSEHPIMLMMALIYFLYIKYLKNESKLLLILAAIIIGLLPFTKLQSLPIAFSFAVIFMWDLVKRKRIINILLFAVTGILPSLLIYFWFSHVNVMSEFWKMYIETNLYFLDYYSDNTFLTKLKVIVYLQRGFLPYYLILFILILIHLFRKRSSFKQKLKGLDYPVLFILFCTFYASFAPGTGFQHYNLLVVFPLFLFFANMFALSEFETLVTKPKYLISYCALLLLIGLGYIKYSSVVDINYYQRRSGVVDYIQSNTKKDDPLCVLGWYKALDIQVDSRRPIASRSAHNYYQKVKDAKLRRYYQLQFIEDLEITRPILVIDPSAELEDTILLSVRNYVLSKYAYDTTIANAKCYKRITP